MTVAMDAMAVAIHIKYALSLNRYLTFYSRRHTTLHAKASSLETTALNTKQQTCSLCNVQTTQNRQFGMTNIPGMSYQQNTVFHCQST